MILTIKRLSANCRRPPVPAPLEICCALALLLPIELDGPSCWLLGLPMESSTEVEGISCGGGVDWVDPAALVVVACPTAPLPSLSPASVTAVAFDCILRNNPRRSDAAPSRCGGASAGIGELEAEEHLCCCTKLTAPEGAETAPPGPAIVQLIDLCPISAPFKVFADRALSADRRKGFPWRSEA